MCLAYPGKIIKIKNNYAIVDFDGLTRKINIELIEKPKIGDFVNVHTGFAIQKMTRKDAEDVLKLYEK